MIELIYALIVTNALSAAIALHFWRKPRIVKTESIELTEFMADLLSGGSIVHVKRIAPHDAVIRVRQR